MFSGVILRYRYTANSAKKSVIGKGINQVMLKWSSSFIIRSKAGIITDMDLFFKKRQEWGW
jgi:hypothetical protein